jgi:hypothetical protein
VSQTLSLGRVNCGASPVQVSATPVRCTSVTVSAIAGMTGKLYFGTAAVNKTTLAGCIKEFVPTQLTAGQQDTFTLSADENRNALNLSDFWIDGTVSGEGVVVSYVVS